MDWSKLQMVQDKALLVPVSFSLNYAECDNSWHFCVSSAAPEEEWTGRGTTFDIAVENVCEWLDSLTRPADAARLEVRERAKTLSF